MSEPSSILLHFGLVVKDLRREKLLSQEELANRCGLHRTYISDIEHGTRNVSLKNIEKISRATDMSTEELFARVDRYSSGGLTLVSHTSAEVGRQRRLPVEILLVEDDQSFIELTLHEMHRLNISNRIHIVRNGKEAVKFLFTDLSNDKQKNIPLPKVILLDLNIPLLSGLELLERIRGDERTKDISVVVLTSSTSETDKTRCKNLGVEEYLTKPINGVSFAAVMRRLGFELLLLERIKSATV